MIKLKSLLETRIINPEDSLTVGDITLYHGTSMEVAKKSRYGELGPINVKEEFVKILMTHFGENRKTADAMYDRHKIYRSKDPNVLFLTTNKEQAATYASYTAKYGGEIMYDMLKGYFQDRQVPKEKIDRFTSIGKPAVVTITIPFSYLFTHPYWKTPAKNRIRNAIRAAKKYNHPFEFGMEIFVYEKIPAQYIQRIDPV